MNRRPFGLPPPVFPLLEVGGFDDLKVAGVSIGNDFSFFFRVVFCAKFSFFHPPLLAMSCVAPLFFQRLQWRGRCWSEGNSLLSFFPPSFFRGFTGFLGGKKNFPLFPSIGSSCRLSPPWFSALCFVPQSRWVDLTSHFVSELLLFRFFLSKQAPFLGTACWLFRPCFFLGSGFPFSPFFFFTNPPFPPHG